MTNICSNWRLNLLTLNRRRVGPKIVCMCVCVALLEGGGTGVGKDSEGCLFDTGLDVNGKKKHFSLFFFK